MTDLVAELTVYKPNMERLCLSHCYIHDRGMEILTQSIQGTKLRYANISWLKLTADSSLMLKNFIKNNVCLEKLLMQHNDIVSQNYEESGIFTGRVD